MVTESEGKSSRETLIIFSLPLPFLSDSLHCSQLCQDCDKLNYQQTVGNPDDISLFSPFFWLHKSFLVFNPERVRTGARWCCCPISAASEALSPWNLQSQKAKDEDNKTSRGGAFQGWNFRKQHRAWPGSDLQSIPTPVCRGRCLLTFSWKSRLIAQQWPQSPGLLLQAPGTGVRHICGSCLGKAQCLVDYKMRAGWNVLVNRVFVPKSCFWGWETTQGEVQWIGFEWEKRIKRKMP